MFGLQPFSSSDQTTNVCCGPSYFLRGGGEIGFLIDVPEQDTFPSFFFLFCCTPCLHAGVSTGLSGRGRAGQNLQWIMQRAGSRSPCVQNLNPVLLSELWIQPWVWGVEYHEGTGWCWAAGSSWVQKSVFLCVSGAPSLPLGCHGVGEQALIPRDRD